MIRSISKADRETILYGGLLEGIRLFRSLTGFGLKEAHELIVQFRNGSLHLEDYLKPKNPCPHCGGTGFGPDDAQAAPVDPGGRP